MENVKVKRITQSTIISMGWTKSMINKLLPEPMLVRNPHYACASEMKLWEEEVVLKVMETPEYKVALEKAEKRKQAAKKGLQTRETNFMELMTEIGNSIKIRVLPEDELIADTLKERESNIRFRLENNVEYCERHLGYECDYDEYREAEMELEDFNRNGIHMPAKETLDRWVVNHIRHNLTDYEFHLHKLKGHTKQDEVYEDFKRILLRRIAETYPNYAAECENQINNVSAVRWWRM